MSNRHVRHFPRDRRALNATLNLLTPSGEGNFEEVTETYETTLNRCSPDNVFK